ncbi:TY-Chap domain-containing protein [Gordonia sp. VNK21]|uniref:TY-Chap domain-containing protein n=1 Tax=Gordonia sp. VNK21 TaxID=3382483 RepID=UPI0038D44C1E
MSHNPPADDGPAGDAAPGPESAEEFTEERFDSEIDRMWLRFRAELADRLADLSVGHPLKVLSLWTEMFGPQPGVVFSLTDRGRLHASLDVADLYPFPPERQQRLSMVRELGWQEQEASATGESHSEIPDACTLDLPEREVDKAALVVERTFREVWDVLDPSFLISEENEVIRRFTEPPPQPRERRMR